ncbi:MAG: 2-amino-4-hydroxy-6-hydroxymethyldihydropteridine diphosphokinase [Methylococcaceae bacterium]|nr:2-amino-4-hydroxy-6-hydroxymethyldihydropteridine diphosphokinase [Methylococcaceae bacterium]
MMAEVYIGLGSNLENPAEQIRRARVVIAKQANISEINFSSLYSSPPMGPQDQPDYVNAVMSVGTDLFAIDILKVLQKIESDFGRVRKGQRWGARILDLDLLLYADQQINLPDLIVPHIGLSERAFVMYPLAEIAPGNLLVPGKKTIKQLLTNCSLDGLEKLA